MRNIVELLGIILPALIILLGIIRVFVKKTKGVNGLTMFFAILLFIIGLLQYFVFKNTSSGKDEPKPPPLAVSKHSDTFNESIENVLSSYIRVTDAFVNNDAIAVQQTAKELKTSLDSLRISELAADSLIYLTALQPYENTKTETLAIIDAPTLDEKRKALNLCSNEFYTLLRIARYDLSRIYWKECAFAFGEGQPGNWLSKTEETLNPYGKDNCAEIRSTINFMPADSTN